MDYLAEAIGALLAELTSARGAQPPITVAAVAVAGGVVVCRYSRSAQGTLEAAVLYESGLFGPTFGPPIHLLFADGAGGAWRAVLGADGKAHLVG